MVSVGLYSRTTIPTIRSVDATCPQGYSATSTSTTYVQATGGAYVVDDVVLQDGETVFCSASTNGNTYAKYVYGEIRNDAGTVLASASKYNSGTVTFHVEYKNTTGAVDHVNIWHKVATGTTVKSFWSRIMIMNDSDLAKWERVNLPTTRYRKYAVDKYYMLAKWTSGSFNIDGYAIQNQGGGIIEVPVETIISSTELTGSGAQFFQVTGQGFTVTP